MLNDEVIDKVIERLVVRIEEGNTYVLEKIGEALSQFRTLNYTQALQLSSILKYGGSYNEIVNRFAEITKMNVRDINKIFEEVAKNDYRFAKQFYEYRGIDYIPYEKNIALQNQVNAIARMTANEYVNLSNTLAFTTLDKRGRRIITDLATTYRNAIDTAVLSVSQGKTTFDSEIGKTIRELGNSGIKTVNTASGRTMRLDSAVRMNLKQGLRTLHNEMQREIGEQFGSDGVEISVHVNPAPDHEQAQGKQFSFEEYNKLNDGLDAKTYQGEVIPYDERRRTISELNCYHYTFDIVLGVSQPSYSIKQLQDIINNNNKGFDLDGKHYTNYEGTQLQRSLELEIRKQKDIKIIAKSAGDDDTFNKANKRIKELTYKYKELSRVSGLPTKMDRLKVN